MRKRDAGRFMLALILFLVPVALMWGAPIRGAKEISETENRTLAQWPALTAESFLSGAYQEALEEAAGDQMIGSERLRAAAKDAESGIQTLLTRGLQAMRPELRNAYTQLADGYYTYAGDEHRIVERPDEARLEPARLEALAEQIGRIRGVRKYLYFIENSRSVDFDHMETRDLYFAKIVSSFELDGAAAFRFKDYDEFCRLFYQTDHHWNYRGSWIGYREILRMMGISAESVDEAQEADAETDDEAEPDGMRTGKEAGTGSGGDESADAEALRETWLAEAPEEIVLPVIFNGSYARQTRMMRADEPFTVYSISLPKHAETMNGKRGTYGHLASYLKGKVPDDEMRNHYAWCYGGDYGEIICDFGETGRGNLLMIVDSYSNPINGLIASHFDKTYIIDPRYYERWAGVPFDAEAYLAEHPADTLLMMGDILFYLGAGDAEGGAE